MGTLSDGKTQEKQEVEQIRKPPGNSQLPACSGPPARLPATVTPSDSGCKRPHLFFFPDEGLLLPISF